MNESSKGQAKQKKGRGEFFAIDRRTWAEVCGLGLNEAVTYLVLAQGTGADNRRTKWSKTAIRKYTGIAWERAQQAIDKLFEYGFVQMAQGHTRLKPRYELLSWDETAGARHARAIEDFEKKRASLSEFERQCLNEVITGTYARMTKQRRQTLEMICAKGLIAACGYQQYRTLTPSAPATETEPELIWLPNAIVTGTRKEIPPVKRLRIAGD